MPLILALIGSLIRAVGPLVANVLLSLGIGFVSYTGINTMVDLAKNQIFNAISGLSPWAVQLVGILKLGTCLNIIFSAIAARLLLAGITNGTFTKMITKV